MKTRFKVHKRITYKIFDIQNNEYWQVCFNDWNTEDFKTARDHCDFMNTLYQNAINDDFKYKQYLRRKHK